MQFEVDMMAPGAGRIIGTEHRLEVIAEDVVFGEGPVWDKRSGQFYFTDICGDTIWKCRPGSRPQVVLIVAAIMRRGAIPGQGGNVCDLGRAAGLPCCRRSNRRHFRMFLTIRPSQKSTLSPNGSRDG